MKPAGGHDCDTVASVITLHHKIFVQLFMENNLLIACLLAERVETVSVADNQ